jgi:PleD family two-component response regulator
MFDQPVVVVKGGNSILDFLDDGLMRFSNNRVCFGAVNALQIFEDTPANVVIMEMDAGAMTGFELAEAIRDIDEERNHFTYIILVGAINHERAQLDEFHQAIDAVTDSKRVDAMEHLALAGAPTMGNMIKFATKELDESVRTESIMVHHIIPE